MACFKAFSATSEIREYRYFRIIYGRVLSLAKPCFMAGLSSRLGASLRLVFERAETGG